SKSRPAPEPSIVTSPCCAAPCPAPNLTIMPVSVFGAHVSDGPPLLPPLALPELPPFAPPPPEALPAKPVPPLPLVPPASLAPPRAPVPPRLAPPLSAAPPCVPALAPKPVPPVIPCCSASCDGAEHCTQSPSTTRSANVKRWARGVLNLCT